VEVLGPYDTGPGIGLLEVSATHGVIVVDHPAASELLGVLLVPVWLCLVGMPGQVDVHRRDQHLTLLGSDERYELTVSINRLQ